MKRIKCALIKEVTKQKIRLISIEFGFFRFLLSGLFTLTLLSCGHQETVEREQAQAPERTEYMAVFGDSAATGVAADIKLSIDSLIRNGFDRKILMDNHELAWGTLLAEQFGYAQDHILIFARNGNRVNRFIEQAQALLEQQDNQLPHRIFVQFTGNDLCNESAFKNWSIDQYEQIMFEGLTSGIDLLATQGKASDYGTHIYILPFFDVSQLLRDEELLKQEVRLGDITLTCGNMQNQLNNRDDLSYLYRQAALELIELRVKMCPSLLSTPTQGADNRVHRFHEIISAFRRAQERAAEYSQEKYGDEQITFTYLQDLEDFSFKRGDLANECFHLGVKGHQRFSEKLRETL